MTPTTAAHRAAFRIFTTCPVRTHERREPPPRENKLVPRPGDELAMQRRQAIREMLATDPPTSQRDMARLLGISRTAVCDHVRAIRAEGRKP